MLLHLALTVGSLAARSERFYREVLRFAVSLSPAYRGMGRPLARLMAVPDCEIPGLFLRKGNVFLELLEYQPAERTREERIEMTRAASLTSLSSLPTSSRRGGRPTRTAARCTAILDRGPLI